MPYLAVNGPKWTVVGVFEAQHRHSNTTGAVVMDGPN